MLNISGYTGLLLGAQVAGIGANLFAARQQNRLTEMGIEADRGNLATQMQQEELAFTEANIASVQNLREVMATQRAIMGARGQNPGAGSALAVANKSIRAHEADKAARDLSKSFRQKQFQNANSLFDIKKAGARSKFGASLLNTGISNLNLNSLIGGFTQQKGTKTLAQYQDDFYQAPSYKNIFGTKRK